MDENNIVIINCLDEIPHQHHSCETIRKYRNGNLSAHEHDKMSVSLVFRVVQKYADYNMHKDTMISDSTNDSVK